MKLTQHQYLKIDFETVVTLGTLQFYLQNASAPHLTCLFQTFLLVDGKAKNAQKRRKDAKQELRSKIPGVTLVSDDSLFGQAANYIEDLEGTSLDLEGLSGTAMIRKVLPGSNKIRGVTALFEAASRHITEGK